MLKIVRSLQPVYLGHPEVNWSNVPVNTDRFLSGTVEEVRARNPAMGKVIDLAAADARSALCTDNIDFGLRIRSGNEMPSDLFSEIFLRRHRRAGAWHIDEVKDVKPSDEFVYFLSNRVSTEHVLGRFATLGQTTRFRTLLSQFIISPQIRHSLSLQVAPGELVRVNGEGVHRSPGRGKPPIVQPDVLVTAYARVAA